MSEPFLARLARRVEATGTVLCVGIDPTPEMLPQGWPTGLPGIERLARLIVEAAAPHAAAVKPNLAFFEAYGSAGHRRPGADPRRGPARRAGDRRRQARRRRDDRRPPGRRPVRRPGSRRGHGQPVPGAGRARGVRRARRPLRLRALPHVEPGGRRAAGPRRRRGPDAGGSARRRSIAGSPGGSRRPGSATAPGWWWERPRPAELAGIRAARPVARLPGARRGRAGRRRRGPSWPPARPARAPRAPRRGGGLLVNVSRGISGAAARRPASGVTGIPASCWKPPRASGPPRSLCYRSPASRGRRWRRRRRAQAQRQEVAATCRTSASPSWSSSS